MSQDFDPKKIIDFNKDYYLILGLTKENLPKPNQRQNKIEISKIIEQSFRKMARKCHPDFGGTNELFLDLVRARRILEDPLLRKIYDQGYFEEFTITKENFDFEVDWNKIGTYRKGSPEDTVGFSLFLKICEMKETLAIIPAFFPKDETHNYEWDWVIDDKNKIALSLIQDENEVLRLTSGENLDESLPFKIYICIPRKSLTMIRDNDVVMDSFGKILKNANISKVIYNDYNLLETTNLDTALKYIENDLEDDLENFKNGKLKPQKIEGNETKWMDTESIKKIDREKISEILGLRSFVYENDENAPNFLDKIENKKTIKRVENKPELPL